MNSLRVLATINLVLGGLVFLLGMLILRENPRQRLNRVVALMMFFGGFGALLTALGLLQSRTGVTAPPSAIAGGGSRVTVQHFAYLWEFFFPSLFLFACLFPQERGFARSARRRPWFLAWPPFGALVYLPHIVHFVLLFLLTLIVPWLTPKPGPGALQVITPLLNIA